MQRRKVQALSDTAGRCLRDFAYQGSLASCCSHTCLSYQFIHQLPKSPCNLVGLHVLLLVLECLGPPSSSIQTYLPCPSWEGRPSHSRVMPPGASAGFQTASRAPPGKAHLLRMTPSGVSAGVFRLHCAALAACLVPRKNFRVHKGYI